MKKFKLFVDNFLIYGVGGIINKIIPFVMVPVVARMMPNSTYFGLSDLTSTLISLTSALAIMGMYDAMYRMYFENDEIIYRKKICSTSLCCTLISSVIVFLLLVIYREAISILLFDDKKFDYLIFIAALATLVGATNQIIAAPTRMQNKRRIYLITNVLSSILLYIIALIFLKKGYFVLALPIASLISGLIIGIIFILLNKSWFTFKLFDLQLLKKMLLIGLPLTPSFIIYWIFNSCDRIMITNILGIGAAGVYAIGSKLGHASQLIYTAFAGGWQYFAFSTMKDDNQVKSNSLVYEYLGVLSYCATCFICSFSYLIYKILFTYDYIEGYIVAPYLFLAPLLQMLFQVAVSQFVVIKKTWPNVLILMSGALLNIVLNYFFIPVLGIEGAAIASLIGYAVSNFIAVVVLLYLRLMIVSIRFLVATICMIFFILIWRLLFVDNIIASTMCAFAFCAIICFLYRNDLKKLIYIKGEI